jgi:hypothetical protein
VMASLLRRHLILKQRLAWEPDGAVTMSRAVKGLPESDKRGKFSPKLF